MKIFFVFLFFNSFCFAQNNSGEVIYGIKKNPASYFQTDTLNDQIKKDKKKIEGIIGSLKFVLTFNNEASLFMIKKSLALDKDEFYTKMAIISTRGNRVIYVDKNKKLILEQTSLFGKNFLIESSLDDLVWNFTKEKKTIAGYVCFKAIASKALDIPSKKEKIVMNYTVWYSPEIPFNFGPYELSGLPGLVLEFSNNQLTYSAEKLIFSKNEIDIEIPNIGKYVTKEEYEKIGKRGIDNTDD